jgi:hypothetical protein
MDNIEIPTESQNFFDKDHISFYTDKDGDIKCSYSVFDIDQFQSLVLTALSGQANDYILNFLSDDLNKNGHLEESVTMLVIKNLLNTESSTLNPIVKPSNFK